MITAIASDYREEFDVREGDIITSPGQFEGEHISVPYFWDCAANGDYETIWDGATPVRFAVITESELEEFPDLKDRYGLAMYETESGIVNAVWFCSVSEYQNAWENPNEVI